MRDRNRTRSALIVCLIAGTIVALGLAVGPAVAGDAIAQFEFQNSEQTAERGETVTVEIRLLTDGGYAGEGVESYSFVVAVPPEVGEPTGAEVGPWLQADDGEVEGTVTDAGEGAIRVRHERVDAGDGVTGADRAATVTIEVHEDAPAAAATVEIADPRADLARNDFQLRSFGDNATIVVAGGGERLEPAYEPERDEAGGSDGGSVDVTTANETNRSVTPDDGDDSGSGNDSENGDDPTPGFGLVVATLALFAGTVYRVGRRRRN